MTGRGPQRYRKRLSWGKLCAGWIICLVLFDVSRAQAQFNAQGRSRPSSPSTRPNQAPSRPAPSTRSAADTDESRNEVLIERYSGLIISQPGEEVPIKRLAQLLRERDGNLSSFLSDFQKKAEAAKDQYPYLVAWAGLLAEDSRVALAVEKLKKATDLDPNRAEAWLLSSRLQAELDQKDEARTSLARALPLVSGPTKTITLRRLRDLSLDAGDYEAAQKYHRQLLKDAAGNVFLRGELGRELLRRGQTEKAVLELEQVAQSSRGDARAMAPAWRDVGKALLVAERFDEAVERLTKASKLAVAQPGLRREIDELLAEAHRQRGSLPEFLDTLERNATGPERLELLGRLYEEEGRTDDATKAYERALSRSPRDLDIRLRLVRLLELTGNLEAASSQLRRLVQQSPNDVHLALRQMELLLAQGRRKETLTLWDQLERNAHQDPEMGLLLVDFAERLGEPERQRKLLERLATHLHNDRRYLVELGARFYREGKEEKAHEIWNTIVSRRKNDSSAHVTVGEVLIDHEAVEQGVEHLRKAVELDPKDSRNRRALALGLERAGTLASNNERKHFQDLAIAEWESLLQLATDTSGAKPMARRRIIRIEKRRGTLPARLAQLEKQLEKDPKNSEAAHLLAEGYLSAESYPDAIRTLEGLLKQSKGDRQALLQLERAYAGAGRHQEVIATLQKLVAADPARAREYYDRMAEAATKRRDFEGALKYAELSVKRNPTDPNASAQLGELYLSQGRTQKAESAFRRALELDDRQHRVALVLAEILSQTKRSDQALPLLFHVVRTAREITLVQRATRRALSMSVPANQTRELEEVLRPLALGRSDQPVYRNLLLETLSAQYYPLDQAARFGSSKARQEALAQLRALAERSTQPLLSALAGEDSESVQVAIDLLSYGDTKAAGQALITFAEGSAEDHLRLRAMLAAGRTPRENLSERLADFVFEDNTVKRGALAVAAVWVLARQHDPRTAKWLIRVLSEGTPDMRAYAAWGLAEDPHLKGAQKQSAIEQLGEVLDSTAAGDVARGACALALSRLLGDGRERKHDSGERRQVLRLLALGAESSPLLVKTALLSLSTLDTSEGTRQLLAHSLVHVDPQVRQIATVAAVRQETPIEEEPLLPSQLEITELDAGLHLARFLEDQKDTPLPPPARFAALRHLSGALSDEAMLAMRSSRQSAKTVLTELRSPAKVVTFGSLLTEQDSQLDESYEQASAAISAIRKTLLPELMRLAESTQDSVQKLALEQLRTTDGPQARRLLERALDAPEESTFQAALFALVRDGSTEAVELLAAASPDETWGRRRRRALSLGEIYREDPESDSGRVAARALRHLNDDPSALVREAAGDALSSP